MSYKSWRDAYAVRNKIIDQRGIDARADSGAVANAASIANASFRDSIKQDNSVSLRPELKQPEVIDGGKAQQKALKDSAYRDQIEKGGFEGFMGAVGQAVDKPVIKQVLDAISTGMYASANVMENGIEQAKADAPKIAAGEYGIGDAIGTFAKTMPIVGVAEGIAGGLGGATEKQFGQAKNIKEIQRVLGTPEEELDGGANGAIQGWGGLAADIALDPLTYATLGVVPIARGLAKGAVEGGSKAKALAREGVETSLVQGKSVAPELQKIATNEKGRLGTAISEAKSQKKTWDIKRSLTRDDKKIIQALAKDPAADATGLSVGGKNYLKTMDNNIANGEKAINDDLLEKVAAGTPGLAESNASFDAALGGARSAPEPIVPEPMVIKEPALGPELEDLLTAPIPAAAIPDKAPAGSIASGMDDIANNAPAVKPEIKASLEDLTTISKQVEVIRRAVGQKTYTQNFPNRAFYSPESMKEFGIDPSLYGKVTNNAELQAIRKPATSRQLKTAIKNGSINRKVMDRILEVTNTPRTEKINLDEVIDKFLMLEKNTKAELTKETKRIVEAAKRKPTRAEEVLGRNEEKLAQAKNNVADVADELAASPKAFTEEVQAVVRRNEFNNAVKEANVLATDHRFADAFAGNPTGLSDIGHKAAQDAISVQLKGAPFKTDGGYLTLDNTSTSKGGAWKPEQWGTNSQIALHESIIKGIREAGIALPNLKRTAYVAALKVADKELRSVGVEPFLNHVDGSGRMANLSLYDVISTLDVHAQGALTATLFNGTNKVWLRPTDLMQAAEHLVIGRAKNMDEGKLYLRVKTALTSAMKMHKGKPVLSAAERHGRPSSNTLSAAQNSARLERVEGAMRAKNVDPGLLGAARTISETAALSAKALMTPQVYEELSIRSLINHAFHNTQLGKKVDDLAEGTILGLKELSNTSSVGESLKFVTDRAKDVIKAVDPADLAKAKDAYTMKMATVIKEGEQAALNQVNRRVAEAFKVTPPAKAKEFIVDKAKITSNGKTALENSKPGKVTPEAAAAQLTANRTHPKEVPDVQVEVAQAATAARAAGDVVEEFDLVSAQIATDTMRKIHPIQSLVNPRLGLTDDTYRAINSGLHSIARQQNTFHSTLLNQMNKRGHDVLTKDFGIIQKLSADHLAKNGMDVPFTLPADAAESTREMFEIMNVLFDTSMRNIYARNGIGADHFNAHMKAAGLPKEWQFLRDATPAENSQLWTQWKGIEKHGVLDFMSKIHSASVKASQDIAIAASFSEKFGKRAYENGYVRLVWKGEKKDASLFNLIDRTQFYPKEIAAQIRGLDTLLTESRSLNTSKPLGRFFVNVFDPVTNALKASQTTVRPGHWVINTAGDLLRNQLAGLTSFVPYRHSVEIMKAARLQPEDFIGNITGATATKFEKDLAMYAKEGNATPGFDLNAGAGKGVNVIVGGKKVKILYTDFANLVNDGIAIPPHQGGGGGAIEDRLMSNATTRFAKGLTKATDFVTDNSKFSLNKTAAFRDNFSRIALAVDYASKRTWKSVDEMKAGMEEHVTKWAPLSTDFTAFEAKYARRSILYYTWLRGIIPRVLDSAMTKPGVATMVPKAMYNMAYANGLHPESVGNPFDPDKLFPEYYSKNILGPQWMDEYGTWGFNPSSPIIEVANTFAGINVAQPMESAKSVGKTLAGMATPFAKIPSEMFVTGTSNGIPIESNSQYLLDNLGGSYTGAISRATGKSLGEGGIVDRTDSAHKDTPEDQLNHAQLQMLNFMTGMKLTDYQSDGAMRSAAYGLRDQAKKEAK